jgi:hypothetical protein
MLIIKGYYYFFAAFVFLLVAISDAFTFFKNFGLHRSLKSKVPNQDINVIQQLQLSKL